jgi:hypothetical protein
MGKLSRERGEEHREIRGRKLREVFLGLRVFSV